MAEGGELLGGQSAPDGVAGICGGGRADRQWGSGIGVQEGGGSALEGCGYALERGRCACPWSRAGVVPQREGTGGGVLEARPYPTSKCSATQMTLTQPPPRFATRPASCGGD